MDFKSPWPLNRSGFTLIEMLVAAGILGIITMAMASTISEMSRQTRILNEKLASLESFRFVSQAMNDNTLCKKALTEPSPLVFDSTAASPTASIPSGAIPLGTNFAAQVGELASPASNSVYISSLNIVNITNMGSADSWQGELELGFDQTKLASPLRPLSFRFTFQTDPSSPPNAKAVESCASGVVNFNNCYLLDRAVPEGSTATETCNAGFKMIWATAVRDGSQDPVTSSNLRLTPDSIWVWARRDGWRILGQCCEKQ